MTVSSKFGDVTVPRKPKRIVVLTNVSVAIVAGGIEPVAMGAYPAFKPEKSVPWLMDRFSRIEITQDIQPVNGSINVEAVLKYKPDLILGYVADKSTYRELSKIAPTYTGPKVQADQDWKERIRTQGRLAGQSKKVENGIANSERKFAAMRSELKRKGLSGQTYQVIYSDPGTGKYDVYSNPAMEELGFTLTAEDARSKEDLIKSVSEENISSLDADILLIFSGGDQIRSNAGYKNLPAVRNNAAIIDPQEAQGPNASATSVLPGGEEYIKKFIVSPLTKSRYATDNE